MTKALIRLTIICVALYFIISYYAAQCYGVDVMWGTYTILFELCVLCIIWTDDSKYFCRYIKWVMLGIVLSDSISYIDYFTDIIPYGYYNYVCSAILLCGCSTSVYLALRHYYRALKTRRLRNERKHIGY